METRKVSTFKELHLAIENYGEHPKGSIENEIVAKLTISGESKAQFRITLARYGIHRATLFPDLDGIARFC